MNSSEWTPIILANRYGIHQQLEGDCACPIPPPKSHLTYSQDAMIWKVAPQLYRAGLPDEHELAFNYLGDESVTVLNRPARELLDSFRLPTSIDRVSAELRGKAAPKTLVPAVQDLISLGLLIGPDELLTRSVRMPETLTVWLHVTNHCNLACDYCYLNKNSEHMDLETGKKAVEAVFRSAVSNDFKQVKLKYSGGEATLNFPLVIELHHYAAHLADRHGLRLEGVVLSNGIALSAQMIESLKANRLRLSISMDGIGQKNDVQRHFINGRGSFSNLERTFDRLERSDFLPSITVTVTARNAGGLAQTVKYLLGRKLPFTINFYRENECSAGHTDLQYGNEQVIQSIREAFEILEHDLPPYSLLGSLVDRARLDASHDRPCGVGSSYFVIDQKGDIAKCHMEIEKTVTNIAAEDPLALIRVDQLGVLNHAVDEKEGCRDCEWRYWCAGGCPALTYRVTGRYDIKSPNCSIYRALFPDVLRLEGLRLLKYSRPERIS
jgi:uncharacterized protein